MAVAGSFSYSGDPGYSRIDRVRFELAETVESTAILSDEEITFALDSSSTIEGAVAKAARNIEAYYRKQVDTSMGPARFGFQQRAESWSAVAAMWEVKAGHVSSGAPTAIAGPLAIGGDGSFFYPGMHDIDPLRGAAEHRDYP